MPNKPLLIVCSSIAACIVIFSQCISSAGTGNKDMRGQQYAGADACARCHKAIYDSFALTAHHRTSSLANDTTVKGSFHTPDNVFVYNDSTRVLMEKRDSGLFQCSYVNGKEQESHRFDIAMGSGTKAQTYLYWNDTRYFELPVSYFVANGSWANSPGYPATYPKFTRPIPSGCFGCHSSAVGIAETKMIGTRMEETFEKDKVIYGIDCERCHGPAASHVAFHDAHPGEKKAAYITSVKTLPNQAQLDMCALCHSGMKTAQRSVFGFKLGDKLEDYYYPDVMRPAKATSLDVHGVQYQLFTGSQCFLKTNGVMNCNSCHNPHNNSKDVKLFSQQCKSCHNETTHTTCTVKNVSPALLQQNCIDCHMPALPSGTITLKMNGVNEPVPDYIHTHLIAIYEEETKKVLDKWKQLQ